MVNILLTQRRSLSTLCNHTYILIINLTVSGSILLAWELHPTKAPLQNKPSDAVNTREKEKHLDMNNTNKSWTWQTVLVYSFFSIHHIMFTIPILTALLVINDLSVFFVSSGKRSCAYTIKSFFAWQLNTSRSFMTNMAV